MSETWIHELSAELKTQDNACTSYLLYCVKQQRRICGLDTDYCEHKFYSWHEDPSYTFETRESALAELAKEGLGEGAFDDMFDTVGYIETWEFVTAHLTRKAAQLYIDQNSHNLRLPRIYVSSQYRCHEFNAAVAFMRDAAPLLLEACKEADRILWMAKEYAEAGGSSGPEMRDYTEAETTIRTALAAAEKVGECGVIIEDGMVKSQEEKAA